MLYLADFSVMNPSFGLLFWTTIIFLGVFFVLSRFFRTIKDALKARETDIDNALQMAENARKEMAQLQDDKKNQERQASEERLRIIREAEAIRDKMIEDAKTRSEETTRQLLEAAKTEIENRRKEMEVTLLNEVGRLSVDIAQQILQIELQGKHEDFVARKVTEMKQSNLN
jgi:F-type H+-transporting ATPase subunit b